MAKRKTKGNEHLIFRSLDGLAYGVFISVVIGQVLVWVGETLNIPDWNLYGQNIMNLTGVCIAVAISYVMGASGLTLLSSILVGTICSRSGIAWMLNSYISIMITVIVAQWIQNRTPVDIYLIPIFSIILAITVTKFISPYINNMLEWFLNIITQSSTHPTLFMSIFIAAIAAFMSILPLVGIFSILGLNSLGCGAAIVGLCSMVIGLTIMSIDENDLGDVIAMAIGTPLFQLKNAIKHPLILLPPILTAMIVGPISSCLFNLSATKEVLTSSLILVNGPVNVIQTMGNRYWPMVLLTYIILPLILCFAFYRLFKKIGWIQSGDLKMGKI